VHVGASVCWFDARRAESVVVIMLGSVVHKADFRQAGAVGVLLRAPSLGLQILVVPAR
jgi:hypothetical protein